MRLCGRKWQIDKKIDLKLPEYIYNTDIGNLELKISNWIINLRKDVQERLMELWNQSWNHWVGQSH